MTTAQFRSVFDIIGPVMIGPSSSHTAGAARIGKIMRHMFGEQPSSVDILLYESFAKTYQGHGTDIALVGGLLNMEPDDERLAQSLKIAHESKMEVAFIPKEDAAPHPNSVTIRLNKGKRQEVMTGISIGGGNIEITNINGYLLTLSAGVPTFVITHDKDATLNKTIMGILADDSIKTASIMTSACEGKDSHMSIVEVDVPTAIRAITRLEDIPAIKSITFLN